MREQGRLPVHVIVTFSGSDQAPGTERLADLLVCEQLASQCIAKLPGLPAARSTIHRFSGRTFLEVERFDRHGAHGRSALCSWAAVNNAWFGLSGRPWSEVAARLLERGLIASETRDAINRLWPLWAAHRQYRHARRQPISRAGWTRLAAGACVRHAAAAVLYAPQRGVDLPEQNFAARLPLPGERELWHQAAQAAIDFWSRARNDTRISEDFRQICRRNERIVRDSSSLPVATS